MPADDVIAVVVFGNEVESIVDPCAGCFAVFAHLKDLLKDTRIRRLMLANTLGSIGSGITIFSIPWVMVNRAGGSETFRWTTIGTTLFLFLVMPYYGAFLDAHSRKAMLLASELFGLLATSSMAITGLVLGHFQMWQLVTIYICGMTYYTLHYPAKWALIQQIFDKSQYQSLTGLMEIQGQTAMMIAGGLGGYLVGKVPLWMILTLDAGTYLTSFLIQSTIPYRSSHLDGKSSTDAVGIWKSVGLGYRWLHERPRLAIFLGCSLMPFVALMAANYLFPIYVSKELRASSNVFAAGEITFALGAIAAGALLPRLIGRSSAGKAIVQTMFIFLAGLALAGLLPKVPVYLLATVLLGFGNAGCRVARSALVLHIVPNGVMGRVGIFYSVIDRLLRTVLVSSLAIIDWSGPPSGFLLLFGVIALSLFGVFRTLGSVDQ